MLGVEVRRLDLVPAGMESVELSGTYASMLKTSDSTFGALIGWVYESAYELADLYSIEVHDHANNTISLLFTVVKR